MLCVYQGDITDWVAARLAPIFGPRAVFAREEVRALRRVPRGGASGTQDTAAPPTRGPGLRTERQPSAKG
jgi:hypothetical protein